MQTTRMESGFDVARAHSVAQIGKGAYEEEGRLQTAESHEAYQKAQRKASAAGVLMALQWWLEAFSRRLHPVMTL